MDPPGPLAAFDARLAALGGDTATRYTLDQVVEATGISPDVVAQLWHSLGRPSHDHSRPAFTVDDLALLRCVAAVVSPSATPNEVADTGILRTMRAAAMAMRRTADAHVTGSIGQAARSRRDLLDELTRHSTTFEELIVLMWRHQLRNRVASVLHERDDPLQPSLCVGFVDLAGYSGRSQQMPTDRLIELVDRFDLAATEVCALHGATLIKTIGDEVMYVHRDPIAGAQTAIDLVDRCRNDDLLAAARAGVTWGTPVPVAGDYYGPSVNLAARLVQLAEAATVLTDERMVELVRSAAEIEVAPHGCHELRGIGDHEVFALSIAGHESSRLDTGTSAGATSGSAPVGRRRSTK